MMENSLLFESPSFNSYSRNRLAEIAATVAEESRDHNTEEEEELEEKQPQQEENDDDDDFEFAVIGRDSHLSPMSANEIFPVFNRDLLFADGGNYDSKPPTNPSFRPRKLMIEEPDNDNPPSSSSEDELEAIPGEIYCVWNPKPVEAAPAIRKKSNSTGSTKRSWKFRDLLYRSNSEGMDTYVFLTPPKTVTNTNDKTEKAADQRQQQPQPKLRSNSTSRRANVAAKGKVNKVNRVSGEPLSAHEIHYVRYRALKEEDRRRSYLPYRQDLVGLFANGNGVSKNLHPF